MKLTAEQRKMLQKQLELRKYMRMFYMGLFVDGASVFVISLLRMMKVEMNDFVSSCMMMVVIGALALVIYSALMMRRINKESEKE